jgi:branched-chain amino acid transport system substrate-binding protein
VAAAKPIKIGAIVTKTGPIDFSASAEGAKAYFAALNARGGLNGRKIQYLIEDDSGDPAKAAAAARKLIGAGVVAFVGDSSLVACQVTKGLLERAGIFAIPGLSADPGCFASPNIAGISTGPLVDGVMETHFFVKSLRKKRIQFFAIDAPPGHTTSDAVQAYLKQFATSVGPTEFLPPGADYTSQVIRAKGRAPQAFVYLAPLPLGVGLIKAAAQQGLPPSKIPTIGPTLLYAPEAAAALGKDGEGVYAVAEVTPLDTPNPPKALLTWKATMRKYAPGSPIDTKSEEGYTAAELFTYAVSKVKGDINKTSVLKAIEAVGTGKVPEFFNGLTGGPLKIGHAKQHLPNHWVALVRLQQGKWRRIGGWFSYPPPGFKFGRLG